MNDPQIWTLIGVFTAAMLGGLTLVVTLLSRVFDARFSAMDAKFDARFDAMDAKFDAKVDTLEARINTRFDHVDRDVQALTARVWRTDTD